MNDNDDGNVDDRSNEQTMNAVRGLRARGIDNAEELLQYGTPAQLMTACMRWDQRKGVGPGLLASWIRRQEFEAPADDATPAPKMSKGEQLRARFAEYAERFPEGSVAEAHSTMQERLWPDDDPCPGDMRVLEATFPLLTLRCTHCDFEAAIPARMLHVLAGSAAEDRPAF